MASSKTKRNNSKKKKFVKKLALFPDIVVQQLSVVAPAQRVKVTIESLQEPRNAFFSRGFVLAAVMIFGLQLCLASGWYYLYHQTILSFKTSPSIVADAHLRAAVPTEIVIKNAGINLPITQAAITDGVWQTSDTTATHLNTSARPLEGGNIVVYGHNLRKIFGNLTKVNIGDSLLLNTQDGKQIEYVVEEKSVVSPEDIAQVLPTDHEVLTVYTCTGFLDSKRLVLKAVPRRVSSL